MMHPQRDCRLRLRPLARRIAGAATSPPAAAIRPRREIVMQSSCTASKAPGPRRSFAQRSSVAGAIRQPVETPRSLCKSLQAEGRPLS